MALVPSRYRPYVAALLGLLVTGLGHLYLRRWLRAVAWIGLAFAVSIAFVPESAAVAVLSGEQVDPMALLPGLLVGVGSALDAFRIARREQSEPDTRSVADEVVADPEGVAPVQGTATDTDEETVDCPACGKPVDPDLGFCHWCTTEFETGDSSD